MRHLSSIAQGDAGLWARTHAQVYPGGARVPAHSHDWGQLVYAESGLLTVLAGPERWVVPPLRAVWIPAGVTHSLETAGRVSERSIYLVPRLAAAMPVRPTVIEVSPLLRELLLEIALGKPLSGRVPEERRTVQFLVDQLRRQPEVPLTLTAPSDPRAKRLATQLLAHPDDRSGIDTLSRNCGGSRRTLERVFRAETGQTIGGWRQQARLLHALQLLAMGTPVTQVAEAVGYDSPSAFISMFTRVLGTTPSRYTLSDHTTKQSATSRR